MKNKLQIVWSSIAIISVCACSTPYTQPDAPIKEVPFTQVHLDDNFWSPRIETNRTVSIPSAFKECEKNGRFDNFAIAGGLMKGEHRGDFSFDDTDPYKIIEGASYSLAVKYDGKLDHYLDSVIHIIATAQEPDGYLYTSRTMNPKHPHEWAGSKRWEKVEELSHEFYNLGHMVEGAIAHYQATGKRNFLDIAIRYADCVCREIGTGEGQQIRVPGHQIAEMALAKLCLVTGQQKYLDQAKFFLDQRGHTTRTDEYSQAHKPVVEQDEAVGHAVRAAYMYAGMADVAALTGDTAYIHAIDRIWDNIVGKNIILPAASAPPAMGRLLARTMNCPICQLIARLARLSVMCMSTTACSCFMVRQNIMMCWNVLYIMVLFRACPWMVAGSSILIRWKASGSTSASLGSAVPVVRPISVVSFLLCRDMCMR